jgi:hypothetical protein
MGVKKNLMCVHHYPLNLPVQMVVVGLVVLDVIFVLIELLLDLKIAQHPDDCKPLHQVAPHSPAGKDGPHHHANQTHDVSPPPRYDHVKSSGHGHEPTPEEIAATVFHCLSMSVLCIFLIEYALKIYVYRAAFFKHCMEIFDLIVVAVSLIFESVFHHSHSLAAGTGLLVVLRLWRVTRIVNGT